MLAALRIVGIIVLAIMISAACGAFQQVNCPWGQVRVGGYCVAAYNPDYNPPRGNPPGSVPSGPTQPVAQPRTSATSSSSSSSSSRQTLPATPDKCLRAKEISKTTPWVCTGTDDANKTQTYAIVDKGDDETVIANGYAVAGDIQVIKEITTSSVTITDGEAFLVKKANKCAKVTEMQQTRSRQPDVPQATVKVPGC